MSRKPDNIEFLTNMMQFGPNAIVAQMLIMEAVSRYAAAVARLKPEDLGGMKDGMVSPEAWIACAKEVHAKMENRLGEPST